MLKILGINDEVTVCGCCGRTDLKKTVILSNGEGEVRYGTQCAANAMKTSKLAVERELRRVEKERADAESRERANAAAKESAAWESWLKSMVPSADSTFASIKALGGFKAARAAYNGGRREA